MLTDIIKLYKNYKLHIVRMCIFIVIEKQTKKHIKDILK